MTLLTDMAVSYRVRTKLSPADFLVNEKISPLFIRAGVFDDDAQQHAALRFHRSAVFLPVAVLALDTSLPVDERLHRFGQRQDFRPAVDLHPAQAVKCIGEDAERCARITAQV